MKYRILCTAILGYCAGRAAWADLTMRYTLDFQLGSFLPASATETMKKQLSETPKESIIQIKGQKVYTSMGRIVMIADYTKGVVILMDPKAKKFASTPMSSYGEKIAAAQHLPPIPPEVSRMFDNVKMDVKTERTGQVATIQGIRGEENLVTFTLEIPSPSGPPVPGMQMRMVMHQ